MQLKITMSSKISQTQKRYVLKKHTISHVYMEYNKPAV